jgi:hypothetical protein
MSSFFVGHFCPSEVLDPDPHSQMWIRMPPTKMNADPQPGLRICFHFIRIQNFRLNTDPDPGVLMTKNWKKKNTFFGSKITIYPSLGLHKEPNVQVTEEAFSSQKWPSNPSNHKL